MSPFTFATFASTTLTWLFVTLLELKASEQAIVLDFFLEHLHGPLKVIINDPDLQTTKLSQVSLPFLSITGFIEKTRKPRHWYLVCYAVKHVLYNKIFLKTTEIKPKNFNRLPGYPIRSQHALESLLG